MKPDALSARDEEEPSSLDVQISIEFADWHKTFPYIETLTEEVLSSAFRVCAPEPIRGGLVEVSVKFDSDSAVKQLNRDYRGKNKPTNVLSFPSHDELDDMSSMVEGQPFLLGDIVLAYGVVMNEAGQQDKAAEHHLMHLLVHGLLHLMGYDHIQDDEALAMERLEANILKDLGVDDPYSTQKISGDDR